MGDLRINPVSIGFNALVQVMRAKYAPNYKVSPRAEVFAEYQKEQFLRNGHVVIADTVDDNNVFDSDGIFYDYTAWLTSCRIRVVSRHGHVDDEVLFQAMCKDMYDVRNFDAEIAVYALILHCIIVRRKEFHRRHGFYPEPTKQWVQDVIAIEQKRWIHTFKGEPD